MTTKKLSYRPFSFIKANHGGIRGELPKEAQNQDPTMISSQSSNGRSRKRRGVIEDEEGDNSDEDLGQGSDEEEEEEERLNESEAEEDQEVCLGIRILKKKIYLKGGVTPSSFILYHEIL